MKFFDNNRQIYFVENTVHIRFKNSIIFYPHADQYSGTLKENVIQKLDIRKINTNNTYVILCVLEQFISVYVTLEETRIIKYMSVRETVAKRKTVR